MKIEKLLLSLVLTLLLTVGIGIALAQYPGEGEGTEETAYTVTTMSDTVTIMSPNTQCTGSILFIRFGAYEPQSNNIANKLINLSYDVTYLINPASGNISSALASKEFQQVWLFDIATSLNLTDVGANAIADWYNTSAKGNIIIDARSYGAYYNIATDAPWIENEAHAFCTRCGGLWIGTDHTPGWAYNGNKLLSTLGYATVSGIQGNMVVAGNTSSELLTTPNTIDPATLYANSSVGIAPTGTQPDGTVLEKVLWNSATEEVVVSYSLAANYCEIPVDVDIKPGSCPNPLNLKSKGVLPVAVLGTEDFDVTTIDPETISLTREGFEDVGVAPIRWSYEDVATPFEGELCDCHDLNGDGILDLTLKFDTQELVETLGLSGEAGDTTRLTLTGNLKEEEGGTPIEGEDCIWVLN